MKKILPLLLSLLPALLSAQGLDPTVRVTGTYKGNVSEGDFPKQEVVLPDSVTVFDTHFDYKVFDKPYQGSYDFSPYLMDLRPRPREVRKNQFYLKAGAGYTLHPMLDAYWNPEVADSCFNLSVYATNRSYWGTYDAHLADGTQLGAFKNGFESRTLAGVKGRYDFPNVVLTWDAHYKGIHNGEGDAPVFNYFNRGYNKARVDVGVRTPVQQIKKLYYDFSVGADYAQDNFAGAAVSPFRAGNIALDGEVGDMISAKHGFRLDFSMGLQVFGAPPAFPKELTGPSAYFSITPHYVMNLQKFKMDLGVNLGYVTKTAESWNYGQPTQVVYPDVRIAYDPWKQWATFYLNVKGGMKMNTYDDILEANPHFAPFWADAGRGLLGSTVERVNASLGVEGKITSKWSYDASVGYAVYGSSPMEGLLPAVAGRFIPTLYFVNYQTFYAGLGMAWRSESFDASVRAKYQGTYNLDVNGVHKVQDKAVFTLPDFLLDARLTYNYKHRVYAGICLEAQGSRKAQWNDGTDVRTASIRPFWNLGLDVQYVFSPEWPFWLHFDNLLFQEIQRNLFYARKGGQFTLGITLNIR